MKTFAWCIVCMGLSALLVGMVSAGSPNPGQASKTVIKGRIIAVDSQEPIAGVKVKIKRLGTARTNSDGRYKIRVAKQVAGRWQVVISAPEYWRRKTWLVVAESARNGPVQVRADWNLLPKNSTGFDLEVFDALIRFGGPTARWDRVPAFRIFANQLDCPDAPFTPDENCPEWIVTSSPIPTVIMEWLVAAIGNVPALTAGLTPTVEIVDLPAGTSLPSDGVLMAGTITLGQHARQSNLSFPRHGNGEVINSHVYLVSQLGASDRGFMLRLMSRGLGYLRGFVPEDLCADLLNRGMSTIYCSASGAVFLDATALDAAMGRALYSRPIGNRSPDVDPEPIE